MDENIAKTACDNTEGSNTSEPMSNPEKLKCKKLLQEGNELYSQGQVDKAFTIWLSAAEKGYGDAQCRVGVCYFEGEGVKQDYQKAAEWFEKAALQEAKIPNKYSYLLGECFYNGKGVKQDYVKAVFWFEKALGEYRGSAKLALAECYYYGRGVNKDERQAMYFYRDAYEEGLSAGKKRLKGLVKQGVEGASEQLKLAERRRKENKENEKRAKKKAKQLGKKWESDRKKFFYRG